LTDKNGNLVENINKIPLTIAIYSSESTPKFIDSNTAGNFTIKPKKINFIKETKFSRVSLKKTL